jgi:hypothetical protein
MSPRIRCFPQRTALRIWFSTLGATGSQRIRPRGWRITTRPIRRMSIGPSALWRVPVPAWKEATRRGSMLAAAHTAAGRLVDARAAAHRALAIAPSASFGDPIDQALEEAEPYRVPCKQDVAGERPFRDSTLRVVNGGAAPVRAPPPRTHDLGMRQAAARLRLRSRRRETSRCAALGVQVCSKPDAGSS